MWSERIWTAFMSAFFFLVGCNKTTEPAPIDHMDEPGEYRARIRESVQQRIGNRGEPVKDRTELIGDWDVSYDRWFEKLPTKLAFIYHLHADGTLLIETLVDDRRLEDFGQWRLNSDGTFSEVIECLPDPTIPGMENGAIDESRFHLLGLRDGRRVLWNGDGSLVLLLSRRNPPSELEKDQQPK